MDTDTLLQDAPEQAEIEFEAPVGKPYWEEGWYVATVVSMDAVPPSEKNPDWGPRVEWHFTMAFEDAPDALLRQEDGNPKDFRQWTSFSTGSNSKAGKWIAALLGRKIGPNEKPKARDLVGKKMLVELENQVSAGGDKVYANIASVRPFRQRATVQRVIPRSHIDFDDEGVEGSES